MDVSSMSHHFRKILLDLQSSSATTPPSGDNDQDAPPSYQSTITNDEALEDDDGGFGEQVISIDASTYVNGIGNIVNTDNSALGAKLAAALATILGSSSTGSLSANDAPREGPFRQPVRIQLNCGIKVIGHRNVVGAVRAQQPTTQQCNKRKFESTGVSASEVPAAKKAAVNEIVKQ